MFICINVVARTGLTRTCALSSIFQALPSEAQLTYILSNSPSSHTLARNQIFPFFTVTSHQPHLANKPGRDTAVFQNTARHTFEALRCLDLYFKTGPSFVGKMWLVAGNSEKRKYLISS